MSAKYKDRHAIKAEIYRRGETLVSLAIKNNLKENDVRIALAKRFPKADIVIADFLNLRLHELWPNRYDHNDDSIDNRFTHNSSKNTNFKSKKEEAA